jgi:hypothetical protein
MDPEGRKSTQVKSFFGDNASGRKGSGVMGESGGTSEDVLLWEGRSPDEAPPIDPFHAWIQRKGDGAPIPPPLIVALTLGSPSPGGP